MERRSFKKRFGCRRHVASSFAPPDVSPSPAIYVGAASSPKNEYCVRLDIGESSGKWKDKLSGFSNKEIRQAWYLLSLELESLRHKVPTSSTEDHNKLMRKYQHASAQLRIRLENPAYGSSS